MAVSKLYFMVEHTFERPISASDFDTREMQFDTASSLSGKAQNSREGITLTINFDCNEEVSTVSLMQAFWRHEQPADKVGRATVHRILKDSSAKLQNNFAYFTQLVFDYCGAIVPPYYSGNLPLRMSSDKKEWFGYPPSNVIAPRISVLEKISTDGLKKYVDWHIKMKRPSSVGLGLLSQARSLLPANPRGAFILAVTGFEVGLKAIIREVAPVTDWLLDEMPAPPALKLLKGYLPKLVPLNPVPPPCIMKLLREAVEKRNRLVHRIELDPTPQQADDVINTVKNALGIIQRSRGLESGWRLVDVSVKRAYVLEECRMMIKRNEQLTEKEKNQLFNHLNAAVSTKTSNIKKTAEEIFLARNKLGEQFLMMMIPLASVKFQDEWRLLVTRDQQL